MKHAKRRFLSLLVALVMIIGLVPSTVLAANTEGTQAAETYTARVDFTAQMSGAFLMAPQHDVSVSSDLSDNYGYADSVTDGVSALDVLIKAHELVFGEDFVKETATEFFAMSGDTVTKQFGVGMSELYAGFFLNHCFANDGTMYDENNYKGTTVNTQKVVNGDLVEFFFYEDDAYGDSYNWFLGEDGKYSRSFTVPANQDLVLTLKSFDAMSASIFKDEAAMVASNKVKDVKDAQICTVNQDTGAVTPIAGAITDKDGAVTLKFAEPGTYTITAQSTEDSSYTLIMSLTTVTVTEAEPVTMTDAEALAIVYGEYSNNSVYGNATKTPLVFPYEYNGTTYTNVVAFLKAWALEETGRELTVQYEANKGSTYSYMDWHSGELKNIELNSFDDDTNVYQDYFKNNADRTVLGLRNVYFKIGDETSEKINNINIKIKSLIQTPEKIVEFVTTNVPFERIANGNESPDRIVKPLVDKGATSGTLPLFTLSTELYSTTSISVAWNLANVSGKTDALKLASNKITVSRPNVGEDDAVFTLAGTVTSKTDTSVSGTIGPFTLTVPAFEAVTVPIQITKGATLELIDSYYGTTAAVDAKYIAKQDDAPEGYDLYNCTLHTNAEGAAQSFKYTVTKEGYLTRTGTFSVTADPQTVTIDLQASTEDDTKLGKLSISSPAAGSADIISGIDFKPDQYEYNVEVKGVQSIKFAAEAATPGATIKITQYYKTLANANSGTLTTTGASATTACYLPDAADTVSVIKMTVTAPAGSTQAATTREYTINVTKSQASGPMTALALTVSTSFTGATKDNIGLEGVAEEETMTFAAGGYNVPVYTVNYWRDKVAVKPTAAGSTITVNGATVTSGQNSAVIDLQVGDNEIPIVVTKNGVETTYTLIVHRKAELYIKSYGVEGVEPATYESNGKSWTSTAAVTMPAGTDIAKVIVTANVEDADVRIDANGGSYLGKSGEAIEVPTKGEAKLMTTIWIYHTVDGIVEAQKFVYSIARGSTNFPDGLETYLPAPGQFVNTNDWGSNPETTLTNNGGVTLGAFGGSIVYRFDEPIVNDPSNPYGVDFIVFGNVFSNSDGSSAPGASEPASVMVSNDGETWYELAGSLYYEDSTLRNVTVTYTNSDTTFAGAVDIPWTDSLGNSGAVLKNSYHSQPYYPNPTYYSQYQNGVGKNSTYTVESVSFTGSRIQRGTQPVFGYGDNHYSPTNGRDNTASNPYKSEHLMDCNGDGFDIAWAVDANGLPVALDSVKYVKIYNPNLADGGATGEVSPEIQAILRAKKADADVGISAGLTSLQVAGEDVELVSGQSVYEINVGRTYSFSIKPTAEGANIYVNNTRVASGGSASNIRIGEGEEKLIRIVVQDGEKAPAIYILKVSAEVIPQEEKDQAAAKVVDDLIEAIGEVTLESKEKIQTAKTAYDALTDAQKAYITKLAVLEAAIATYEELANQDFGSVRVIVENTTFTPEVAAEEGIEWSDAFWSGTLVDTMIDLTVDSTMMSAVVEALEKYGYTQSGAENNYIEVINGLAAYDGGDMSGWMGTLNDWFVNEGFGGFTVVKGTLENGDEIRVLYTRAWGADIGGDWSVDDTHLADLKSSVGVLDPAFDPEMTEYTLVLPTITDKVTITPTAINKNFQVHISVGETEYKRSAEIPVTNGTVIKLEVGTGASMSSGTPTTYTVTVTQAASLAYDGSKAFFVKASLADEDEFGMWRAKEGSTTKLEGDNIVIHIVPNNTTTYAGFHWGEITDAELTLDVPVNTNGTIDITVPKEKGGRAYFIAPIKKSDGKTSKEQYYLAIPSADKLTANEEAAASVEEIIADLPATHKLTLADKEAVQAALDAYEALSDGEKAAVDNYEELVLAEATIEGLEKEAIIEDIQQQVEELQKQIEELQAKLSRNQGWNKIDGAWYYCDENLDFVKGWVKDGGKWYFLDKETGVMQTGWVKDGDTWYYMNTSGAMQTGWVKVGDSWYYLKTSGAMAASEWCEGYWLNANGTWTYTYKGSWKQDSTGWWFGDTSGWYAKSTTQKIDNVNYTFNAAGYWVK